MLFIGGFWNKRLEQVPGYPMDGPKSLTYHVPTPFKPNISRDGPDPPRQYETDYEVYLYEKIWTEDGFRPAYVLCGIKPYNVEIYLFEPGMMERLRISGK